MNGDRFALKVAGLAVVVALLSFLIAYQLLDDDSPDAPPSGAGTTADVTTSDTTTTTAAVTTTTQPGAFATPAWVAVVASEGSRGPADEAAAAIAAEGYPAGVLRSDDYPSLKAGLWVGYAGPYGSAEEAEAAVDRLDADGIKGAYVRCIGTKQECGGDGGGEDDD